MDSTNDDRTSRPGGCIDDIASFDAIYDSMLKCKRGVIWKDSVASFYLNGIEQCLKLSKQLQDGSYSPRPPRKFMITAPKKREAISVAFRDRVYQRSLVDNAIYQPLSRQFIFDNYACQKGKGTDPARDRLADFMRRFYRKHGRDGYALLCDIRGYYSNMRHEVAESCFTARLSDEVSQMSKAILRRQYTGDVGYNAGSQIVQIAGISVLSPLDHYIKEKLRIKYYLRYMDDFLLLHESDAYLRLCREEISRFLQKDGFELHPVKTRIVRLCDAIPFLGFRFKLTDSGKVLRGISPDTIRRKRRKLRHMVAKCKRGDLPKAKVDDCFRCDVAYLGKGTSFKLVQAYKDYYTSLWEEGGDYAQTSQTAGDDH